MENLQGEPEARIVGFPIGLQAVGAFAGGTGALAAALRSGEALPKERTAESLTQILSSKKPLPRARTAVAIGAGGALAGAALGKLANQIIATTGNNKLPTTQEYGVS
jgi:hypothetical protein